jgi:hypothetical protein
MVDMAKREIFEKAQSVMASDGYPEVKEADPLCHTCRGHGIVDTGTFACVLEKCPDCWMTLMAVADLKAVGALPLEATEVPDQLIFEGKPIFLHVHYTLTPAQF